MRLLSLGLRNYRNYGRLDLEPGANLNVFLGRNGQGKTNLLESVALLALSSSPRARRDGDVVGPLGAEARVEAVVEANGRRREIRYSLVSDGERTRRRIEVDGAPRRAVDLPGVFRVTLFWPDDLGLVKGGPELRRRFLNQMLVQAEPGYARDLAAYARVLEQRNSLLKQVAAGRQDPAELGVWDSELARLGTGIAAARARAVTELAPVAAAAHTAISGGESLEIGYLGPPQNLLEAVHKSLPEDLRRGSTSLGPHRDDLTIVLGGRDARAFASQGQQRSAVVSLKLAEATLVRDRSGESPVLLLDDVLSELDHDRRRALMDHLGEGSQVIVTSVEADFFPAGLISAAQVRCISEGRIDPCG